MPRGEDARTADRLSMGIKGQQMLRPSIASIPFKCGWDRLFLDEDVLADVAQPALGGDPVAMFNREISQGY